VNVPFASRLPAPASLAAALSMLFAPAARPADQQSPAPSFDAISRQAAEARDAKRLDEALALYKKALKLNPEWDEGWWEAGSIAYDRDEYAECAPDFHRLTALKPDLVPAWTMAGLCDYHLRDYDAALQSLRQTERLGFKESQELSRAARLHLALVLTRIGNYEKALVLLTELTRIDKKTPDIMVAAGIAGLRRPWIPPEVPEANRDMVFKLGDAMGAAMELDTKGAIEKFELAVRDYPKEPDIHFRFGAFLMQQDPDRGIQEIRKALDLDPEHIPALVSLATIYLKRDDQRAAREYAGKAVKLAPGDFATHVTLGRVLLETGDSTGAARELELAVKLAPESPEARFNLASAYAKLGRKADAAREREEFRRLRKLIDSNQP
jgi:tetratricopeptide (TPR) repeat protein